MGAYAAGKAGLLALLRSIGQEEPEVHTLALIPLGTLDTPGNRAAMPEVDPTTWIDPKCMAEAVVFALTCGGGRIEELRFHPPG
jgi:NAD(P)-dependent dehydrogenase (short-subunit alcohol dehydrogenase family)